MAIDSQCVVLLPHSSRLVPELGLLSAQHFTHPPLVLPLGCLVSEPLPKRAGRRISYSKGQFILLHQTYAIGAELTVVQGEAFTLISSRRYCHKQRNLPLYCKEQGQCVFCDSL